MAQYTASYTHSGATGTYTLTLTLGQSNRNIAANTSDITYSLVLSVTGSGFGSYDTGGALTVYSDAAGANIVNESYSARASCNSSSPLTLFSGSVTGAAHNTDGTLNLTLNASAYRTGSNPYFNQTLSIANKLFEAEANQRATIIGEISPFNIEDTFSITTEKQSESFEDTLTISLGESVIKTLTDYESGGEIALSVGEILSAYESMGVASQEQFTFEITTTYSSTEIGTTTAQATGKIGGTALVKNNGEWKRAAGWVKVGGSWVRGVFFGKVGGEWRRGRVEAEE